MSIMIVWEIESDVAFAIAFGVREKAFGDIPIPITQ